MTKSKIQNKLIWILSFVICNSAIPTAHARLFSRGFNEVAVDVPFDGGGLIIVSRVWKLNKYVNVGLELGGGVVEQDFEVVLPNNERIPAETQAAIFPYIGPRISAQGSFIGASLGFGAFYAKTDFEVTHPTAGRLTGRTRGWGTAFYAPLLVIDFYNTKSNILFGVGIGGFIGTSYPTLEAAGHGALVRSDETPLETFTIHFRMLWPDRKTPEEEAEF